MQGTNKSSRVNSGVLRHGWKTKVGVFHNFLSAYHTLSKFGEEIYLIYLNCHAQFGSHVTNYDITISKNQLNKNVLPKYRFFSFRCKVEHGVRQKQIVDTTKILHGKQNCAVHNELWPKM